MTKKIVFISHITEERELAIALKELIESSFLGMIDVFVSSDEHNISLGQKWLDNITTALKTCTIEIVLCSPKSILKPWINFEAGAGWIRDIPVIPLCHSGIEPEKLPLPLNLLQATKISELSGLKLVFPVLANAIGAKTPNIDFSEFLEKVIILEKKYTFWDECNQNLAKLHSFHADIIPALKSNKTIDIDLTETDIVQFQSFMGFFEGHKVMKFLRAGGTKMTTMGTFYDCKIVPLENNNSILTDSNCKF